MSKESERRIKKMEQDAERAAEERRRELFRKRLEIAKNGLKSYQLHRIGDAAQSFHTYIRVLEEWKKVNEGELNPTLFDAKDEAAELLLLTGVYWDLAKMYDRTRNPKRQSEFQHYLDKYVAFSKGSKFQQMSAETLRKYLAKGSPMHMEAFRKAYVDLGGGKCFVATALLDVIDEDTFFSLKRFRDEILKNSIWGRAVIRIYYRLSPRWVLILDRSSRQTRTRAGAVLDFLSKKMISKIISAKCRSDSDGNSIDSPKN